MPTCQSCNAKVLRTDAFCGSCGEPVPGAKPVVPISREATPSGSRDRPERLASSEPSRGEPRRSARALAAVALSEPHETGPREAGLSQTAIREQESPESEPAPVVPLHRRKEGDPAPGAGQSTEVESPAAEEKEIAAPSADASLPNMPVPAGPPILASDLLRQQMRPQRPGQKMLRVTTVTLCGLGAVGAMLVGGAHPLTFVSIALLVMMATLALIALSYRARAISLCLLALTAAAVALWQQVEHGMNAEGIVLAGATILLSGSLLFRAYYRGARSARFAVALGVTILWAWFVSSGAHESLVALEGHWQSWGPAATHMAFGLVALLSLLAFMESSTRGGSHVWAFSLLVLYACHIGLGIASELFPRAEAGSAIEGPTVAVLFVGLIGTIVGGLALAQVFVSFSQNAASRPRGATED